jgi:threonine dehydrogenase-like Zn-dependent dehydrogenase
MKALYFDNNLPKILALKALSVVDKYAAFGRFSPVRYADVPEPKLPNPRWLKVRNLACGLCGTDIHFLFMDMDPQCFSAATPGIARKFLGHELVGEIVEVGAEADGWRVGERVALRIEWPSCFQLEIDPPCRQCRAGNYMLCENLGKKQLPLRDLGGGFSPHMVMHRTQPYRLPKNLSLDRALLLEPTASALHGVRKGAPRAGERALVIGAGTIGLLCVAIARALSPKTTIDCVARHPFQADAARRLGADEVVSGGKLYERLAARTGARYFRGYFGNEILLGGYDVVYDTVGNDRSINDALRWARGGGRAVILGINFHPGKIDYSAIWTQELQVTGINCHAMETASESSFDLAAKLLADPKFPVDELITHRFPLDRYQEAVKTFLDKEHGHAIKIVLEHGR